MARFVWTPVAAAYPEDDEEDVLLTRRLLAGGIHHRLDIRRAASLAGGIGLLGDQTVALRGKLLANRKRL